MASIAFDSRITGSAPTVRSILSSLKALPRMVHQWEMERQTRNALSGLSDKQLDDIGLVRGDIDTLTNGSLRKF